MAKRRPVALGRKFNNNKKTSRTPGKSKPKVGSGVVAPGFKPVQKGGKVVPKRVTPTGKAPKPKKKSPVFDTKLPKPGKGIEALAKLSQPRRVTVKSTGEFTVSKPKSGTVQESAQKLRGLGTYNQRWKALQKEERRQEKILGKPVELRMDRKTGKVKRLYGAKEIEADNRKRGGSLGAAQRQADAYKAEIRSSKDKINNAAKPLDLVAQSGRTKEADAPKVPKAKKPGKPVDVKAQVRREVGILLSKGDVYSLARKAQASDTLKQLDAIGGNSALEIQAQKDAARRKKAVEGRAKDERDAVKSRQIKERANLAQTRGGRKPGAKAGPAGQAPDLGKVVDAAKDVAKDLVTPRKSDPLKPVKDFAKVEAGLAKGVAKVAPKVVKTEAKVLKAASPQNAGKAAAKEVRKAAPKVAKDLVTPRKRDGLKPVKDFVKVEKKLAKAVVEKGPGALKAGAAVAEGLSPDPASQAKRLKKNKGEGKIEKALPHFFGLSVKEAAQGTAAVGSELASSGKTREKFIVDMATMLKSIPAGAIRTGEHPIRTLEELGKDYKRRYGKLAEGDIEGFKKRLKKEGVAAEVVDILTVAAAGAGAAGKGTQAVARSGQLAKLPGKAGRVGARMEEVATTRPKLALGGGDPVKQRTSRNYFVNEGYRALDNARRVRARRAEKKFDKRVEKEKAKASEGDVTPYNDQARVSPRDLQAREANAASGASRDAVKPFLKKNATVKVSLKPKMVEELRSVVEADSELGQVLASLKTGTKKSQTVEMSRNVAVSLNKAMDDVRSSVGSTDTVGFKLTPTQHQRVRSVLAPALEDSPKGNKLWREISGDGNSGDLRMKLRNYRKASGSFAADLTIDEAAALTRTLKAAEKRTTGAQQKAIRKALDDLDGERSRLVRANDAARGLDDAGGQLKGVRAAEALRRGDSQEVVPTLSGMKVYGPGSGKVLRKKVADIGAIAYVKGKVDQQRFMRKYSALLKGLSKQEQRGVFYAMNFGIGDAKAAKKFLPERMESIKKVREEMKERGESIPSRATELDDLQNLIDNAEKIFTPEMKRVAAEFSKEARKQGLLDPSLTKGQVLEREVGAQAKMLGIKREDFQPELPNRADYGKGKAEVEAYEAAVEQAQRQATVRYLRAVDRARRDEGLERPGYFRGEKRPRDENSVYAMGGPRAVKADSKTTYSLIDKGLALRSPDTFARGVLMNIKRRHNWAKVADTFDAVTLPEFRNLTVNQILDLIDEKRLDPKQVALWNPRRFRENLDVIDDNIEQARAYAEVDAEDVPGSLKSDDLPTRITRDDEQDRVFDALNGSDEGTGASVFQPKSVSDVRAFVDQQNARYVNARWSVVPRSAYDEIMDSANPSGSVARAWDIAKGKSSRLLLGNPVWLQLQIASNAFMSGLAGTGPITWVKANIWWRKLTPEQRRAIAPYIGVHRWYDEQTHLGASTPGGSTGWLVNHWRGLKQTRFMQQAHKVNPFDALFKADNAQNNFFRRAVFYNEIKKQAYRDMGESAGRAMAAQERIVNMVRFKTPTERMNAVLKNEGAIMEHAKAVDDFLGNWTSYTAKERRLLGRSVMFYGFIRFSTKLTFYTMPMKHPLMSSILLKLGQMEREELQRIFGTDVPFWEVGNVYSDDGSMRWEVSRINPFLNTFNVIVGPSTQDAFQGFDPKALLAFFPPMVVHIAYDQMIGADTNFGRPWSVDGRTEQRTMKQNTNGSDRLQIFLGKFLRQSAWYRTFEQVGIPGKQANTPLGPLRGKQTTDSLVFQPEPVRYKDASKKYVNRKQMADQRENWLSDLLQGVVTPIQWNSGTRIIRNAKEYQKDQAKKKKGSKKDEKGNFVKETFKRDSFK